MPDIVYPDETSVHYQYDELNRKISMEDKNGTTKYGYDQMGHLTKVENPTGETVKYEYDQKGRKTKVIYPDGKYVSYSYDKYDRLITITDREGRKTSYTYDNASRKKTISLPNGITTSYEYDKASRITGILSQKEDGTQVEKYEYTYDKAGNKTVEEIWKEGKHYRGDYTYYKNNTVKEMTESGDNSAHYFYHYDGAGNIDQKTVTEDDTTKTYTYTYDSANRMITESQNGKMTRTYRYDENGNRIARVISGGDEENSADGAEETAVQATSDSSPLTQDTDETEASAGGGFSNGRKEVIDYFYYDYTDQLEEIVEHNGHNYTYGYDGEGNRLWRTYSQYSVVKPPVDEGERDPKEEPGEFNNGNGNGNGLDSDYGTDNAGKNKTNLDGDDANQGQGQEKNGNGKDKTSSTQKASPFMFLVASAKDVGLASYNFNLVEHFNLAQNDNNGNGNGNSSDGGSNGNNGNSGNGGNDGNGSSGNGNSGGSSNNGNGNGSNGNGNSGNDGNKGNGNGSSGNGNSGSNSNSNSGQGLDASDNNKGQGQEKHDKNDKNKGNKDKGNNGKHLGWYKNKHNPHYIDPETGEEIPVEPGEGGTEDGGYDLTNPEIFQVTNYINDLSEENAQVLMTTDVDGNYRGVYTYDNESVERISEEDLGKVEGRPNNPLYYLKDALGTITSITNMNGSIIDSNRFAPYGEALDPVAKNARLTNSPFGFTGESHDIDEDLIYLRARYYEPDTMRFIQQDTYLGEIENPLSRNLYAYAQDNPLKFTDPTGHKSAVVSFNSGAKSGVVQDIGTYTTGIYGNIKDIKNILGGNLVWTNTIAAALGFDNIRDQNKYVILYDFRGAKKGDTVTAQVQKRKSFFGNEWFGDYKKIYAVYQGGNIALGNINEYASLYGYSSDVIIDGKVIRSYSVQDESDVISDWSRNHSKLSDFMLNESTHAAAVMTLYRQGVRKGDFENYSDYEKLVNYVANGFLEWKLDQTVKGTMSDVLAFLLGKFFFENPKIKTTDNTLKSEVNSRISTLRVLWSNISSRVNRILLPYTTKIKQRYPDAKVGYRGSLATGIKFKTQEPFNHNDFDVDAFIVSDKLAAKFKRNKWRDAREIGDLKTMADELEIAFKKSFEGYRSDPKKPFTFRVWTESEFQKNVVPFGYELID